MLAATFALISTVVGHGSHFGGLVLVCVLLLVVAPMIGDGG